MVNLENFLILVSYSILMIFINVTVAGSLVFFMTKFLHDKTIIELKTIIDDLMRQQR